MRATLLVLLTLASGCNCGGNGNGDGGTGGGGGATGGGTGGSGGSGGGAGGLPDGGACIMGATALSISPTAVMKMELTPTAFTVNATVGGNMQNVSTVVSCSATRNDDTPPGTFNGTTFTPSAAGEATVTCTD